MRIEGDNILEVGETVTVRLGRSQDLESRIVLNPVNGVIRISDNDGVLQLLCTLVCRVFFKSRKQTVVGLQTTFYTVSENREEVEVCVKVSSPNRNCPIEYPFDVLLSTQSTGDDSAGDKRNGSIS